MTAAPTDCHRNICLSEQGSCGDPSLWCMTLLQVMGLLLHGDAAFAGQGLVAELLQMSNVPGGQAMASQEL